LQVQPYNSDRPSTEDCSHSISIDFRCNLPIAPKKDFNNDGYREFATEIGGLIPDSPLVHFGSDSQIRLLFPPADGLASQAVHDTEVTIPQPYSNYWYLEEQ